MKFEFFIQTIDRVVNLSKGFSQIFTIQEPELLRRIYPNASVDTTIQEKSYDLLVLSYKNIWELNTMTKKLFPMLKHGGLFISYSNFTQLPEYRLCYPRTECAELNVYQKRPLSVYYCYKSFHSKELLTNVGDILTPYVFEKAGIKFCRKLQYPAFFGIGSVLHHLEMYLGNIWSSGFLTEPNEPLKLLHEPLALRGKLSRKYVEPFSEKTILGDGGLVVSSLYNPELPKKYKLGIVPHLLDVTEGIDKMPIFFSPSVLFIDVRKSVEEVLDGVVQCENILSSSLHGLVFADSYHIPNAWFSWKKSQEVLIDRQKAFKFEDYYSAFDVKISKPQLFLDEKTNIDEYIKYCEYRVPAEKIELQKHLLMYSLEDIRTASKSERYNVCSFVLWGDNSRYHELALQSIKNTPKQYQCWFYIHQNSVPNDIIQKIRECKNTRVYLFESDEIRPNYFLAKRLYPHDNPFVEKLWTLSLGENINGKEGFIPKIDKLQNHLKPLIENYFYSSDRPDFQKVLSMYL